MPDIPFWSRVVALLLFAVGLVLFERRRHPGSTDRLWEYGVILLGGVLGAIYGVVNDAVTSNLSPYYFILGKGLVEGDVRYEACLLGAQAGFSAGVIAIAVWTFVMRRVEARKRSLCILRHLWIPCTVAVALSVLLSLLFGHRDPLGFSTQLMPCLPQEEIDRFLRVWWAHLGAYGGLLLGVVARILLAIRRCAGEGFPLEGSSPPG